MAADRLLPRVKTAPAKNVGNTFRFVPRVICARTWDWKREKLEGGGWGRGREWPPASKLAFFISASLYKQNYLTNRKATFAVTSNCHWSVALKTRSQWLDKRNPVKKRRISKTKNERQWFLQINMQQYCCPLKVKYGNFGKVKLCF